MVTDPRDVDTRKMAPRTSRTPWALLAVFALLIVSGFMLYNGGGHGPDRTANENTPAVIQTNPSGPERPSPGQAPNAIR